MKRIEAQIMGRSYLLSCPEGDEARLRAAVQRVDAAMCSIRDEGKIKARDRVAVLAALNLAFEALAEAEGSAAQPTAPADASSASPAPDAGQQAALSHLLERMDQALSADGRLV